MRGFQSEYDRLTRIGRYLRLYGYHPMRAIELVDMAQAIIRVESRMAGREVR